MKRDKSDNNTALFPPVSLFRGLYERVARRLEVDPSYVSRVARGERKSVAIQEALREELLLIGEHLNIHNGSHNGNHNGNHNGAAKGGVAPVKREKARTPARKSDSG